MSKRWITLVAVMGMGLGVSAWAADHNKHQDDSTTRPASTQPVGERYVCPMGCIAPTDKPGKCPVCGMKLVKQEATTQPSHKHGATTKPAKHGEKEPHQHEH